VQTRLRGAGLCPERLAGEEQEDAENRAEEDGERSLERIAAAI